VTPEAVRSALAVRLYQWALQEWERELGNGLPMLRAVRSFATFRLLELMDRLSLEEQRTLAAALMKRFHPEAVTILGEQANEKETVVLARWDSWRRNPSKRAEMLGERGKLDRKRLSGIIQNGLSFLGPPEKLDSLEWRYVTTCDGWVVETHIDLGGRFSDVAYHHDLGEAKRPSHMRFVSALSWLGVGGGTTKWKIPTEEEATATAIVLGEICRHFMNAVPGLVGGLSSE
jgi:hypothetical protein